MFAVLVQDQCRVGNFIIGCFDLDTGVAWVACAFLAFFQSLSHSIKIIWMLDHQMNEVLQQELLRCLILSSTTGTRSHLLRCSISSAGHLSLIVLITLAADPRTKPCLLESLKEKIVWKLLGIQFPSSVN